MYEVVGYHRPSSIDEAVELLATPGRRPLGGGTKLRHRSGGDAVEVVDLQGLRLDSVTATDTTMTVGAMTRLQALADHDDTPALVADAARDELPGTLRALATVGGTIDAADRDSVLVASLLAHRAEVTFADGRTLPIDDVLWTRPGADLLIVSVTISTAGEGAIATTARTPADVPIVAAVGLRTDDGVRLALTGVADVPVLVDPTDVTAGLDPHSDFRGSAEYRLHLATTLAGRVLGELR